MLDMANKIKGFQRRATQKVMQQMGLADKTQDETNDHNYQNFHALGSFTSQLKATIQSTDSNFEKLCTAQAHLAGQVQSYLHTELSGDTDLPPGELYEFFGNSTIPDAHMHAVLLQEVSEKFYGACSEIGNQLLRTLVGRLDDAVIKPIMKDEEFNVLTKELIEEKKRATLDYDSYRRIAASTNSPSEQEKSEIKVRNAKERFDIATRRVAEHVEQRNRIRCKILIHGILTAMQQYAIFYAAAGDVLKETASVIKPLIDVYQLSESQLLDTVHLEELSTKAAPPKHGQKNAQKYTTADSLFEEHAQNNGAPPRPKNPSAKSTAGAAPVRHASPQPPKDSQLDDLLQQNITGMKKPASTPAPPNKNTPMNQQVPPSKPPPSAQSPPQNQNPNPNQNQAPPNSVPPQNQAPSPPPKPAPSLVDPFGDSWTSTPQPTQPQPAPATTTTSDFLNLGDLNTAVPPVTSPPTQPKNTLYDDLLGFSTPLQPTTPPLQPNPIQPNFNPLQPQRPVNSPTPAKAAAQNPPPQQQQRGYGATGGFPAPGFGGAPPMQPQPAAAKPQPQAQPQGGFGGFDHLDSMFGPTPTPAAPTPQPAAAAANSNAFFSQPTPAAPQSYVPQHQTQEQEERHELNPAVTEKIQNWAQRGGRQNNLRSLLSTLHEVIWVDSGWDALSLAELVTPIQVKKAYLRANKIVHPDKIQQGTVEQKLIAQRLFEALRVSYEAFDRDELSK
jgi:hypothetical protein